MGVKVDRWLMCVVIWWFGVSGHTSELLNIEIHLRVAVVPEARSQ